MKTVSEYFGENVFDDRVMKATLSAKVYNSLRQTTLRPLKPLVIRRHVDKSKIFQHFYDFSPLWQKIWYNI